MFCVTAGGDGAGAGGAAGPGSGVCPAGAHAERSSVSINGRIAIDMRLINNTAFVNSMFRLAARRGQLTMDN